MNNYESLGLNSNLQPTTGLIGQPSNFISNTTIDYQLESLSATQINLGAITTSIRIASKGNIILNDGTVDRILIGYQSGGF